MDKSPETRHPEKARIHAVFHGLARGSSRVGDVGFELYRLDEEASREREREERVYLDPSGVIPSVSFWRCKIPSRVIKFTDN